MSKINWSKVGFIKASKYRLEIIKSLGSHPKTPSEIAEKKDLHQSHISTTLSELGERDLVKCLNPEANKGRLYSLTDEGLKILKQIDDTDNGKKES